MKITTVREIEDDAAAMLREKGPVLVTRHGRLAGIFFPQPETTLPLELKRELFAVLTADVARQVASSSSTEEGILAEFSAWRKKRRESRRRR